MEIFRTIRTKLWICVGVAFIGFLIATLSTFHSNSKLSKNLTTLGNIYFPLSQKGEQVLNSFKEQTKLYESAFLLGEEDAVKQGDLLSRNISVLLDEMITLTQDYDQTGITQLEALKKKYDNYAHRASKDYMLVATGEEGFTLQNEIQAIGRIRSELLSAFEENSATIISSVAEEVAGAKSVAHKNTNFLLALFLIVLLLSIPFINLVANKLLIRPLKMIQGMVGLLAKGELSLNGRISTYTRDEIGELAAAIYDMSQKLKSMVFRIDEAAMELAGASGKITESSESVNNSAKLQAGEVERTSSAVHQIIASIEETAQGVDTLFSASEVTTSSILEMASSTEELAVNADELSRSVEEVSSSIAEMATSIKQVDGNVQTLKEASDITTSSVTEMDASIKQVEQNATDIARIAEEVHSDAEAGKTSVKATIVGIQEIKEASEITSGVIKLLSNKANEIGAILSVINEVTEQTNLLALNAFIIAAQSGEHGRGFAVVANEIKELANRTTHSTNAIVALIEGVQAETHKAVEAIHHAETRIAEGEKLSQDSGEALDKIVTGIQNTAAQMEQIASSTVQQAEGSKMIKEAMENVSIMVNQIATATSEQQKGAARIIEAEEQMKSLTAQVKNSTREQSTSSKIIADSTESMNQMIQQIKRACDEQMLGSKQIIEAIEGIQVSTDINLGATSILNETVVRLSQQTQVLQKEMAYFQITEAPQEHRKHSEVQGGREKHPRPGEPVDGPKRPDTHLNVESEISA